MSVRTLSKAPTLGTRTAVGSYVGNGAATQSIAGVGFRPRYVWILRQTDDATNSIGYKNNTDAGSNACFHDLVRFFYGSDMITIDADGFTVGDGTGFANEFNVVGKTYRYVCFG